MNTSWIKPNLKGILLFIALFLIILNFLPSPTITYSFPDGTQTQSGTWLCIGLDAIVVLLLYPFCMWLGTHMDRQGTARLLTGPLMIFPQGFLIAVAVGQFLYEPPEIHRHLERHIFLQGNTDWGGGCLFAGTIALYVIFGFTASWYLTLKLNEFQDRASFLRTLGRAFWILKFHIAAFTLGGFANFGSDAQVTPNDFRNMFLFAGLIYFLSVLFICVLHQSLIGIKWKLALAPLFIVLWLIIGSDGNTSRAGQLVQSGQDPQPIVRGKRHAIMISWHHLCDSTLGDIGKKPEN